MSETEGFDSSLAGIVPDPLEDIKDFLSGPEGLALAAGIGALVGGDMTDTPVTGYQGSIPQLTAVREAVPGTSDTTRRPGSGGRRYFSDIQYIPQTGGEDYNPATALSTAQTAATTQAKGLETLNKNNPAFEATPTYTYLTPTEEIAAATAPASTVATTTQQLPNYYGLDALTKYLQNSPYSDPYAYIKEGGMATGGGVKGYDMGGIIELIGNNPEIIELLAYLTAGTGATGLGAVGVKKFKEQLQKEQDEKNNFAKGKYLDGKTDGMADEVPARIDGVQEARLSDGEFVIPADVVSHLGNGNSDAGAKVLESMMARVRKARTGNTKQGKEINPRDFLPA
tara:strand:+ start:45 stop:1064 length:1020 start_codon:yes stop_codon:yes gene_type:complete